MTDPAPELVSGRVVRRMAGDVNRSTLHRWRKDPNLGFPEPVQIRGQNYYRRDEVDAWLRRMAAQADGEPEVA